MSQTLQDKIKLKIDDIIPHLKKGVLAEHETEVARTWSHREDGFEFEVLLKIRSRKVETVQ